MESWTWGRGRHTSQFGPLPPWPIKPRAAEERLERISKDCFGEFLWLWTRGILTLFILSQAKHWKHSMIRGLHDFLAGRDLDHYFSDEAMETMEGGLAQGHEVNKPPRPIPGLLTLSLSVFCLCCIIHLQPCPEVWDCIDYSCYLNTFHGFPSVYGSLNGHNVSGS